VDRCYFAKEPPEVELRGGLAFIRPAGAHCEIAITPNGLAEFIASAKIALAEWRIKITQALMSRGVPIALSDFDGLPEKPGRIAA
jgi:hypothetical protein